MVSKSTGYGLSNQLKIRSSIVEEILKTEQQYLKTLTFVVQTIKPSLEVCSEKLEYEIDDGHVRGLFGNISALHEVHQSLCAELEAAAGHQNGEPASSQEEDPTTRICHSCFGKVYVKAKESLKAYDLYCSNFARAEKLAIDVLNMTTLSATMKKWEENLPFPNKRIKGSTTLEVCLNEPLNHLCKTSVLLKALAVFTSISQPDLQDSITAFSIVHATLTSIEAGKRAKALQRAYEIYDTLELQWENVGLLNKQGFLTKRGGNVKSWKIRWFTLRSYELKYFDEPIDEKALGTLNLQQCKKVFETNSQMKPNCFGLALPDRTYFIYAVSECEKLEWITVIAWKLYMLLPAEEKARLALSVPTLGQTSVMDMLHAC